MIKQTVALITFSVVVTLTMSYAHQVIQLLVGAHAWVSQILTTVFSGGPAGSLAKGLIALLSIPLLAGLVPAISYWMVRRHWFPYFMEIVWIVWFIQAGALIVLYKAATG